MSLRRLITATGMVTHIEWTRRAARRFALVTVGVNAEHETVDAISVFYIFW